MVQYLFPSPVCGENDWGPWSTCSPRCGIGLAVRVGNCANDKKLGGSGIGCPCIGKYPGKDPQELVNRDYQVCLGKSCGESCFAY